MSDRLQELIDHHDIRRMLAEYCHGCDRCDEDLMGSVYLEDSWDDHGPTSGPGPEFARVMTERIRAESDVLSHLLGQSLINVTGDTANAETYFLAVIGSARDDGSRLCHQLGGRYVDRLERVGDTWKIKHRSAIKDWSADLRVEPGTDDPSGLKAGRRDARDTGAALLGLAHFTNESE